MVKKYITKKEIASRICDWSVNLWFQSRCAGVNQISGIFIQPIKPYLQSNLDPPTPYAKANPLSHSTSGKYKEAKQIQTLLQQYMVSPNIPNTGAMIGIMQKHA